jgi:hypothetical protein
VQRRPRRRTRPPSRPLSVGLLVDPLFHWLKLDEPARQFRALRAFSTVAGPHIGARARAERLRGATLYVRVSTSAWSHQLHALKATLLDKLRQTPGGEQIEDLRFNVGPLDEVPSWDAPPGAPAVSRPARQSPPPPADELVRAMGEVADDELREELTRLYARLGTRRRP